MEKAPRNLAVDAYRGFVMLLMMAEVVQLSRVAKALPESGFWSFLGFSSRGGNNKIGKEFLGIT